MSRAGQSPLFSLSCQRYCTLLKRVTFSRATSVVQHIFVCHHLIAQMNNQFVYCVCVRRDRDFLPIVLKYRLFL